MSVYSIPAMSLTGAFRDLDFVAKYVDQLLASTGDRDYATVFNWGEQQPGPYPPFSVLERVPGGWLTRDVLVSIRRRSDGKCEYVWSAED